MLWKCGRRLFVGRYEKKKQVDELFIDMLMINRRYLFLETRDYQPGPFAGLLGAHCVPLPFLFTENSPFPDVYSISILFLIDLISRETRER